MARASKSFKDDKHKKKRKEIKFTVYGKPFGKQRPRVCKIKGRSIAYTPKETSVYEDHVKFIYNQIYSGITFDKDESVALDIVAYYAMPKSTSKKTKEKMLAGMILPTVKPDVDNIIKIIADALNKVAYKDDKQLVAVSCQKFYSDLPRVEILISEIKLDSY